MYYCFWHKLWLDKLLSKGNSDLTALLQRHVQKPRPGHLEQMGQLHHCQNMIWILLGSLVRLLSLSYKIGELLVQC